MIDHIRLGPLGPAPLTLSRWQRYVLAAALWLIRPRRHPALWTTLLGLALVGLCAGLVYGACNSIPTTATALRITAPQGPHDHELIQRDGTGRKIRHDARLVFLPNGEARFEMDDLGVMVNAHPSQVPPFEIGGIALLGAIRERSGMPEGTPVAFPVERTPEGWALRVVFVLRRPQLAGR